jgi:hypothetical protein
MRTRKILLAAGAMVAAALLAGMAARPVNAGPLITVPAPIWEPSQYDGATLPSDAPDLTMLPTVHAVYVYPSDGSSRFLQFAAMFQRDARRASTMLDTSVARAIRWDERDSFSGRYLDITVVKSQYTAKRLASSQQFSLVKNDLSARGLTQTNKKYLVWLDAPSSYCGQSDAPTYSVRSPANKAEARTVSVIYRYSQYDVNGPNGGFCAPVLHELAHAMGAVQPSAPHYTSGHCNDNGNDLLCIFNSAIPYDPNLGGYYYDYGNDDYWDPAADPTIASTAKLPWWTVNLSRFICPPKLNPETATLQADCSSANSNPGY